MKNSKKKKRDTFPSKNVMTASPIDRGMIDRGMLEDDLLLCGHYLWEHVRMLEAIASSELAGAKMRSRDNDICDLIEKANADIRDE